MAEKLVKTNLNLESRFPVLQEEITIFFAQVINLSGGVVRKNDILKMNVLKPFILTNLIIYR